MVNYLPQAVFSQNINKAVDPIPIPAVSLPFLPPHIQEVAAPHRTL